MIELDQLNRFSEQIDGLINDIPKSNRQKLVIIKGGAQSCKTLLARRYADASVKRKYIDVQDAKRSNIPAHRLLPETDILAVLDNMEFGTSVDWSALRMYLRNKGYAVCFVGSAVEVPADLFAKAKFLAIDTTVE